ncbi:MAG: SdpI family protein [Lachnospiraceae bacterium]|nr:SdpI family protein [Lachnospiraceae bacterium]
MKQIRESQYFKVNCITTFLCLIPVIMGGIAYPYMPEMVATHFDSAGIPNGYSSKIFGLIGLPLILVILQVFCCVITELDPRRQNAGVKMQYLSRSIIPVVGIFAEASVIGYGLYGKFPVGPVINLLLGVILVLFGNFMPKCKSNYTIGIKIPTTLADEENWNKTHRLTGFVWSIAGLVIIACSFTKWYGINILVLAVIILFPIVYSVGLASQKNRHKN